MITKQLNNATCSTYYVNRQYLFRKREYILVSVDHSKRDVNIPAAQQNMDVLHCYTESFMSEKPQNGYMTHRNLVRTDVHNSMSDKWTKYRLYLSRTFEQAAALVLLERWLQF